MRICITISYGTRQKEPDLVGNGVVFADELAKAGQRRDLGQRTTTQPNVKE